MVSTWPSKIMNAQALRHLTYSATVPRIPYGNEMTPKYHMRKNCKDCCVRWAQVHVPGCDVEICPPCGGQLISCECPIGEYTAKRFEAQLLGKDEDTAKPIDYVPLRYGPLNGNGKTDAEKAPQMIFAVYRRRLSLHMGLSFTSHCERGPTISLPSFGHDDVAASPGVCGLVA
jgi:hypothetical protein